MIEISGLQKKYNDLRVLEDINIEIQDGDIYGLVGKSGVGKSTLLYCINGIESYNAGSLKVNGVEIKDLNKRDLRNFRQKVAMIFQHFALMSRKTVYDNIAFPMKCWKYDKKEIDKRVRELAEVVGITDKLKEKPSTLSGGQKQRIAIARALSMNPKILLSDEATSALDPSTTQSILQLLKEINEQMGITIIIVTHQMSVVRKVCKNMSLLQDGHVVVKGSVEKLFLNQPPELRRFMGEEPIVITEPGEILEIMLLDGDASKSILGVLARDLNIDFSVVGGKMEKYQEKQLGILLVSFKKEDISNVKKYLDSKNIIWHNYQHIDEIASKKEVEVC